MSALSKRIEAAIEEGRQRSDDFEKKIVVVAMKGLKRWLDEQGRSLSYEESAGLNHILNVPDWRNHKNWDSVDIQSALAALVFLGLDPLKIKVKHK